MRWWVVSGFLVISNFVSSQPTTAINDVQEQSKTGECCPCTDKDASSNRDSLASSDRDASGNTGSLASADQDASGNTASMAVSDAVGDETGAQVSLAGLDECPCRFRDADTVGSPSVFFPTAVRAVRPFVSLEDFKEDSKPLLHPEVGLASSVLKTLKEATEEEYEEALARDAARSAAQTLESDGVAEESARNVVTVVVSPKQAHDNDNDIVSEVSHVQESRWVDSPLGQLNLLRIPALNPPNLLSDLLALPRRNPPAFRHLSDMDSSVEASNINEDYVTPRNELLDKLSLKTSLGLPNLFPKNKDGSLLDLLKLSANPKYIKDNRNVDGETSDNMGVLENRIPNIFNSLPKSDQLKPIRSEENSEDSEPATTNVLERYSGFSEDKNNIENINFDSKLNEPRQSLLENIQDRLNNLKVPTESLFSQNRDTTSDLLNELLKSLHVPNLNSLLQTLKRNDASDNKETKLQNNVIEENNEKEKQQFTTEILDKLPNVISKPNIESITKTDNFNNDEKENETELQNDVDENPGTEILDSLPDTSEINQIMKINGDDVQFDSVSQDKDFSNKPISVDFNTVTENFDAKNDDFENVNAVNLADENIIFDISENENGPSITDRETCDLSSPKNMDSVSDTSNNLMISSPSEQKPFRTSSLPEQNFEPDDARNSLTTSVKSSNDNIESEIEDEMEIKEEDKKPKTKSLKFLRERLLDGLKKLRVPHTIKPKTVENDRKELSISSKEEKPELLTSNEEAVEDSQRSENSVDNVSIDELQKMSDSLLDKEKQVIDKIAQRKLNSVKQKPHFTTNYTVENEGLVEPDLQNLDLSARETVSNTDVSEINSNELIIDNFKDKENSCPTYFEQSKPDEPLQINQNSEMSVGASEPISNFVKPSNRLTSTLFSNPVVQPSTSKLGKGFIENLLNNPLSSFSTPNIINFNQRLSDDKPTNFNDDKNMLTQASTSSLKSALAPLQQLDDLDLDIFQIKPLMSTQNGPLFPKLPRLNVNTYKAKVAVPKSLALKPLKLESTLGSKKGMFGATLTLSPEKKQSFNPSTLVNSPLASLPRLEDLHETMLENAHNILSTPLDVSSRNMIEDTLRSTQVLSENLRVQADNTVKNLQQNLESTLKEAKISSDGLLGNSVIGSNLLEAVSRSHDDFGDKLKGIHYDLNDRLETLRNDIADHIPTLGSSMFREGSSPLMFTHNPISFSSNLPNKRIHSKPTSLRQSQATKMKPNSAKSSYGNKKPFVMPTASSVTTSSRVSSDKLKTTPIKTSKFKLKNEPSLSFSHNKDISPLSIFQRQDKNTLDLKRPAFMLPFKPIKKENKVKITFSATTPQPKLITKPLTSDKFSNEPKTKQSSTILKSFGRKSSTGLKSNLFRDSNLSPSEIQPTIIKAPFSSINQAKSAEEYERFAGTTSRPAVTSWTTKPLSPALGKAKKGATLKLDKLKIKPKTTISPIVTLPKRDRHTLKSTVSKPLLPSAWPVDEEFLTKVREALRARFSELNPKLAQPVTEPKLGKPMIVDAGDMAKAASDNIDFIKSNSVPMKENTSYTCKMLCTKNS